MPVIKQQLTTEEELFCTRYELETLAGIVTQNELERWVPGFCSAHTHTEHVLRYQWVKDFVTDKTVLDIGCGTGFGSYTLAEEGRAAAVTGWDIDEKTIKYASLRNKHPRLSFDIRNAEKFRDKNEYDVVISFETIEHLNSPEAFLKNVSGVLAPGGTFFVSTPISSIPENQKPDNRFHITEWGFRTFREFVSRYLHVEEIYVQLYGPVPKKNRGMISGFLRKTGLTKGIAEQPVDKLTPHKWVPGELKEELIGTELGGYQLLQCKIK